MAGELCMGGIFVLVRRNWVQLLIRPNERIDKIKWNLRFLFHVLQFSKNLLPLPKCLHSGDVMPNNNNSHFVKPLLPSFFFCYFVSLERIVTKLYCTYSNCKKECSSLQLENSIHESNLNVFLYSSFSFTSKLLSTHTHTFTLTRGWFQFETNNACHSKTNTQWWSMIYRWCTEERCIFNRK